MLAYMARRYHPPRCKVCGTPRSETEPISAQGFCFEHGNARMIANNTQLRACSGPFFDHWRRRCAAAFGVVPDELQKAS